MRTVLLTLLLLLGAAAAAAQTDGASCGVRYLSADHVYLDAGRLAGLEVGMTVRIVRDGTEVAELQVEYAADHSASCRVVQSVGEIKVGDRAFFSADAAPETGAPPCAGSTAARPPAPTCAATH